MSEKQKEESKTISNHDFYFETPLYEVIQLDRLEEDIFDDVDAYSSENNSDTTYSVEEDSIDVWQKWVSSHHVDVGFFLITLKCKRKNNDVLRFIIYRSDEIIIKIGQYPSLADLQFSKIGRKYNKVLLENDLQNFKKAIGLASYGIGAGSFVYLRKIFENLIFETYQVNKKSLEIKESDFNTQRMAEKVETLKGHLPSQLVEMKNIYSILSKGVHELTEQECLKYFNPMKLSIELILDQKIDIAKEARRDAVVKKQIQDIQQKISGNNNPDKK